MDRNMIIEKLSAIFRDVFDDPEMSISDTTTIADIEDWDSLAQINIIVACEKEFKIKFEMKEVTGIVSVKNLCSAILKKMG